MSVLGRRALLAALVATAACDKCGSKPASNDEPPLMVGGDGGGAADGGDSGIRMRTWKPKSGNRRVAILLLHGAAGPGIFTDEGSDHRAYPEAFAQAGFSVFMPYYTHGGDPYALSKGGFLRVSTNTEIDKVAVVGFSRGAAMALRLAIEEPKIAVLVELYGYLSDADAKKVKRMPPTLILHGEQDNDVKVQEAYKLDKLFSQKKIDHEMKLYADQGHGFSEPALADSAKRIVDFIDLKLASPPIADAGTRDAAKR